MTGSAPGVRSYCGLALLYAAIALVALAPALSGGFVSDDIGYVVGNPWIHALTLANVRAILAPTGPAAAHTANYAPVHLLLHAVDWRLFGAHPLGHHVVNVLVHAVGSTLLVALFVRYGVPFAAAALGGALFLLHPANVEAVAWVFQLKTVVSLALGLGALLLEPRRPLAATVLFALALLAKIQAAFAIPVAAVAIAIGQPADARGRGARAAVLAGWVAILVLAMLPEWLAFQRLGHADDVVTLDTAGRIEVMLSFVARYLVMATTTIGLSAFQQPDLPRSWLDPWCLAGAAAVIAMGARALLVLARRDVEAVFWAFVAGGFVPVSQVLPFLYPIADRYLYFLLPGLIGVALVAAQAPLAKLLAAPRAPAARVAAGAAGLLLVGAGARAHERAGIWKSDLTLSLDAAAHYPDGIPAQLLRAQRAAQRGDVDEVVDALRAANEHGLDRFYELERDPVFARVRDDPRFRDAVAAIAATWIAHVEKREAPTVPELRMWGLALAARGDWDGALARLQQAQTIGGPGSEGIGADLADVRTRRLRAERRRMRAAGGEEADGTTAP